MLTCVSSPATAISSMVSSSTKLLRQTDVAYLMAPAWPEGPPASTCENLQTLAMRKISRLSSSTHDAIDVNQPEQFGELKGIHDLLPVLESVEVGDVARVIGVVDVSDGELACSGLGHADLGAATLSLTCRKKEDFFV